MEMMPYSVMRHDSLVTIASTLGAINWRATVPVLRHQDVSLRELQPADAPSLLDLLTTDNVVRFISPPPTTIEGFRRFITWTHRQREKGQYVCFGIVPRGCDDAIGLFQVQMPQGPAPEWGFVMGSPFWGSGLFVQGANALLDFAFRDIGLERLAARASILNGRGNGALRKLGAVRESVIPNGFEKNGVCGDQYYWTIGPEDRARRKVSRTPGGH